MIAGPMPVLDACKSEARPSARIISLPERATLLPSAGRLAAQSGPGPLRVKELEEQLTALRTSLICSFNQLLDLRDLNTGVHSTRLAEWALQVAGEIGLDDELALSDIEVAALLHDIGKIGIPDSILHKPAKLTDEEYDLMKKHPEYGWAVLQKFPGMERASLLVRTITRAITARATRAVSRLRTSLSDPGSSPSSTLSTPWFPSRPYRPGLPFEEAVRRLVAASGISV